MLNHFKYESRMFVTFIIRQKNLSFDSGKTKIRNIFHILILILKTVFKEKSKVLFSPLIRSAFRFFIISMLFAFSSNRLDQPDVRVSLEVVNMKLGEVLKILEQKTNFTFSYLNEELPLDEKVTLDVKDKPLQQVLEILSNRFEITFNKINTIITIKKAENIDKNNNNPSGFGTIRGIVRDSETSEVLPYANVYIKEINRGASTDNRGFFVISSIPANKEFTMIITYIGYTPKKIPASIQQDKVTDIDINLSKTAIEIEDIVVSGKREEDVEVTVQKLSIKELEEMSFGVETDVMRSIQSLPGVQSAGDVSAKYYVRGGASNENLVLLNETPIYNPFHALGIFSVIDPDMINSVEFFRGGFGPKYDGRLSSIMDIITKDGNKNNFGATAALSQLTVKTALEGPIPYGSFIVTARKSYSNEILKKFTNDKSIPIDFYDASFKINFSSPDFLPISKFTLFGFISEDKIDYKSKLHADFNWLNSHMGFNWFTAAKNNPSFLDFTFYYSKFSGGEIPNLSNNRYIENRVDDYTGKFDFYYIFGNKNEFYGGGKANYIKNKLILSSPSGKMKDAGSEGTEVGVYTGYRLFSLENLKADIGSRFNLNVLSEGTVLYYEPRVNVIYSLLPTLNLKTAWGIYQQELVTISDEDEVLALFEPWIVIPKYLKTPTSIHYIGGGDYYLTEKLKVSIEGYYKAMHNLAVVNDELIYPTDTQLINGSGKSYGAEITVNYKNSWTNTQLSYSYSWSTKKIRNIEYHPRYDGRNAVKIFTNFELGKNWSVGINWNYSSGLPFTSIYGYYSRFNSADILTPSSIFSNYAFFPILADRNIARLPDYHRLDMNLSKKLRLWFMDLNVDLSVMNVYNRKNFFYFDLVTGERVNMLPFLFSTDIKVEL